MTGTAVAGRFDGGRTAGQVSNDVESAPVLSSDRARREEFDACRALISLKLTGGEGGEGGASLKQAGGEGTTRNGS